MAHPSATGRANQASGLDQPNFQIDHWNSQAL
jgi:hypothetical protein